MFGVVFYIFNNFFVVRGGYASVLLNMLPLPRGLLGLLGVNAHKRHNLLLQTVVVVICIFAVFGINVDAKVSLKKFAKKKWTPE